MVLRFVKANDELNLLTFFFSLHLLAPILKLLIHTHSQTARHALGHIHYLLFFFFLLRNKATTPSTKKKKEREK